MFFPLKNIVQADFEDLPTSWTQKTCHIYYTAYLTVLASPEIQGTLAALMEITHAVIV